MMQEDGSSQPFYTGSSEGGRRYEPPQMTESHMSESDYYTAASVGQPLIPENIPGERRKNFPPCKPMVHHNISVDISPDKRLFVTKAYLGWYLHCFCLLWNFCVMMGGLITGEVGIVGFFLGLACLILGPPISFFVYFLLYRAVRNSSAAFFVLWFCFFIGQLAAEVFFTIGLSGYGAAGFVLMITTFTDQKVVMGVLGTIATFLWLGAFVYNLWIFYQGRGEFKNMGGAKAATKEFAKKGVETAYENRQVVKDVIVENKDAIKQVAVENKDTIINFAKEHKQDIVQFASENKEAVTRIAMENQDAIWDNRDVVASVFESGNKS